MNTTTCRPQELHPAIPTLLALLSVGGLAFNAISLWIFWFIQKRWNAGTLLQFNLAVMDTIVLPVTPLMVVYFALGNHWPFGQFLCQLQVFMLSTHLYGSIYFLMLISVHRYQATIHYHVQSLWRQKTFLKKLIVVVWAVLLVQGLPIFFFLKTTVIDGSVKCLSIHQSELSSLYLIYSIILGLLGFLLPFGVSCTSYVMLGSYIARISQANLRGRLMKTKSIQMIVVALVIFGVCFMPLHVCGLVASIARYQHMSCQFLHAVQVAYFISVVFTMVNCCLDPFIYNFANEKFNQAFLHALKRFLFK